MMWVGRVVKEAKLTIFFPSIWNRFFTSSKIKPWEYIEEFKPSVNVLGLSIEDDIEKV